MQPTGEIGRHIIKDNEAQTVEKPGGKGRMQASQVVTIPGVVLRRSESGLPLCFRSLTGVTVWLPDSLNERVGRESAAHPAFRASVGELRSRSVSVPASPGKRCGSSCRPRVARMPGFPRRCQGLSRGPKPRAAW